MHNLVPPKPPQPPQVNAAEFLALRTIVMGLVATILARAGPIDGRRRFRVSLQGWPLHVGCRPLFGNQRPLGPRNVHWPVGPRHLGQRAFAGDAAQCPLPAVVNWRADVRTSLQNCHLTQRFTIMDKDERKREARRQTALGSVQTIHAARFAAKLIGDASKRIMSRGAPTMVLLRSFAATATASLAMSKRISRRKPTTHHCLRSASAISF
jgi:hypothetical protein